MTEQSFRQELLSKAAQEILTFSKNDSLAKARAIMNSKTETALLKFQTAIEVAQQKFEWEISDKTGLNDDAPVPFINPHAYENQK